MWNNGKRNEKMSKIRKDNSTLIITVEKFIWGPVQYLWQCVSKEDNKELWMIKRSQDWQDLGLNLALMRDYNNKITTKQKLECQISFTTAWRWVLPKYLWGWGQNKKKKDNKRHVYVIKGTQCTIEMQKKYEYKRNHFTWNQLMEYIAKDHSLRFNCECSPKNARNH